MDDCQTLFLTKEQCKKKGNGIHLTNDQLNWLRGVVSNDTSKDPAPAPVELPKENKELLYMSYTLSIKKELLAKIRTFCYQHGVTIREFFETIIVDSKILSDITTIDYKLGFKEEHVIKPTIKPLHEKIYAEMASLGYVTRKEASKILGVCTSVVGDYMKKSLVHIRKGRFSFFKKEDIEKFMYKMMKKRHKEF